MKWIALTLLAGLPLGEATAQESPVASILNSSSLEGRILRLTTDQIRITGRLIAASDGQVTLGPAGGRVIVAMQAIDTVWVRKTAAGTGAIVGGVIGGAFLGIAFNVLVHSACEDTVCRNPVGPTIGGAALGGAIGAVVGAGIGALIPKWKRRFP
jgi:hypothetical protein